MAMAGVSTLKFPPLLHKPSDVCRSFSVPLFPSILEGAFLQYLPTAGRAHKSHVCRTGLGLFVSWEAHSHLGWALQLKAVRKDLRKRAKCRVVQGSLFGVGAPEALVIGVVALLVFGPKGLAEVARTLGKSLRAFQPTIRELQEVSREFKNTLEQEIGLDELRSPTVTSLKSASQSQQQQTTDEQNGPPARKPYSAEDYLKITEEEIKTLIPAEQSKGSDVDILNNTHPSTTKMSSNATEPSPEQSGNKEVKANGDNII